MPRKALTSEAVALCRRLGSQATRLEDIVHNNDPVIAEFIRKGMEAVNAEAPSESARVVQWAVLDTDFSVGGGELGEQRRGPGRSTAASLGSFSKTCWVPLHAVGGAGTPQLSPQP